MLRKVLNPSISAVVHIQTSPTFLKISSITFLKSSLAVSYVQFYMKLHINVSQTRYYGLLWLGNHRNSPDQWFPNYGFGTHLWITTRFWGSL